jgi:hypothetical protein
MLLKTSLAQGVKHALGRNHFLVHDTERARDSTWRVECAPGGLCHRVVGGIWTLAGVVQRGLGEGNNLRRPLKKSLASHDMLFINLHFTFHTYIPTRLNCYVLMIFLAILSLCKKLK